MGYYEGSYNTKNAYFSLITTLACLENGRLSGLIDSLSHVYEVVGLSALIEFKRYAEECRERAAVAACETLRDQWLRLAGGWDWAARERAELLWSFPEIEPYERRTSAEGAPRRS